MTHVLRIEDVEVYYDGVIHVLKGVSLTVPEKGIVALLGANGAGKSTTLKAVSNLLRAERGEVACGAIEFLGRSTLKLDPADVVRLGIVQVLEGRRLFEHLTVEENLRAGAYAQTWGERVRNDLERVYEYFPSLAERRELKAGYLSGGEQQMTAIGRALDGTSEAYPPGRTLHGAGAAAGEGYFSDRPPPQPRGRRRHPSGRAECPHGAFHRSIRLCDGGRPDRLRRSRRGSWPATTVFGGSISGWPITKNTRATEKILEEKRAAAGVRNLKERRSRGGSDDS